MALNKVMLIGNVGNDPEIRYLDSNPQSPQGSAKVASFRLATTERYRDRSGETRENTEWHSIVAWRSNADLVEKFVHKGSQIYVEGKLRTRQWTDQTGNKRFTTEIQADNIQLLGKRPDAPQPGAPGGYSGQGNTGYSGQGSQGGYQNQGNTGYSGQGSQGGYQGQGGTGYSGQGGTGYSGQGGQGGYQGQGNSGYSGQGGQGGYQSQGNSGYAGQGSQGGYQQAGPQPQDQPQGYSPQSAQPAYQPPMQPASAPAPAEGSDDDLPF